MDNNDSLEQILIKTGKYLTLFHYNQEDSIFMECFNKHFIDLRVYGYEVKLSDLKQGNYTVQLKWGEKGISRPEIIYVNQNWCDCYYKK